MNGSPKRRRSRPVIVATLVALASASSLVPAQNGETIAVDFDAMECGKPPAGMTIAQTGTGTIGVWTVVEDPTSRGAGRVVLQTDRAELNSRFPLCVYDGISAKDVAVTVAFKTMKGDTDRAAGLFVRYVDQNNYYCCRVQSFEDNYRFYKVVDGRRSELAEVSHIPVMEDVWQTLRLEAKGNHFRLWMNGTCLIEADDDTFPGPGKVGLWTKGDSLTAFDDLVIGPPGSRRHADFESAKIGEAPDGWMPEALGHGARASWSIVANPDGSKGTKSVTAGKAENASRSGWVLLDGATTSRDVSVFTRFKVATEGRGMHSAGLVARYAGRDDHYYLRINPKDCNIRLYRVAAGKRKLLGEVHHTRHDEKLWHTAQMTAVGPRVEVLIDGVVQFVAYDDAPPSAGKAGIWAAPGGDTLYDEVSVESL